MPQLTYVAGSGERIETQDVHRRVAEAAEGIYRRADELALEVARAITREVRSCQAPGPVPADWVAAACRAHLRPVFGAMATGGDFDTTAATELGIHHARDGLPLASVMEAYFVGFRLIWEAVAPNRPTTPGLTVKCCGRCLQTHRRPGLLYHRDGRRLPSGTEP